MAKVTRARNSNATARAKHLAGAPVGGEALPVASRRHALVAEVERGLRRCGLAAGRSDKEQAVVIGVSGGADSVALLLACLAISRRRSKSLRLLPIAVHVHHHLRDSAGADANWVKELCHRFGIQLHIKHVYPAKLPGNASANARQLRYEALVQAACDAKAHFVAVAHHAEDQLETMLAALCRGAGLEGLSGMPWARPLDQSVSLIRPMLATRKCSCEEFCRTVGIRWRVDPSNIDPTKLRARLRRDVLPVLEELWPDAPSRVTATADLISAAKAALEVQLQSRFGSASNHEWNRDDIGAFSAIIIAAGLRRAVLNINAGLADELNQRHLIQAAETIQSQERRPHQFDWPGGLHLKVTAKKVSLSIEKKKARKERQHV